MFEVRNSSNLFDEPKPKKERVKKEKDTFISFGKKAPGVSQVDEVVIKLELKENKKTNKTNFNYTLYIGNPYKLGLLKYEDGVFVSTNKVVIIQDENSNSYLVINEYGRDIKPSHTWGIVNITPLANYMYQSIGLVPNDKNAEHRFSLANELTTFKAVGPNINGLEFQGYLLTYVDSIYKKNFVESLSEEDRVDLDLVIDDDIQEYTN